MGLNKKEAIDQDNRRKLTRLEALFGSLTEMREVRRQLMEANGFEIIALGLPNTKIIDIASQSRWHTEILKIQDKFIKDLEDLIIEELK
jgi:hypothetical protein